MARELDLDDAVASVSGDKARRELARLRHYQKQLIDAGNELYGQATRRCQDKHDPLFHACLAMSDACWAAENDDPVGIEEEEIYGEQ